MAWLATAIPAAIAAGSSIAGMVQQANAQGASRDQINQAIQEFIKISVPDPEQQKLELQHYQSTGSFSPQLEHSIKQDPSAFEGIVKNQQYSQAQDRALGQLQSLGEEGGLSLSDKADLQGELLTSANKDRANRDAITDDYARRGQLGSGMELQAQLSGNQAAGDRDAMARLQTLGSARDRALAAISGSGDLAGKLQGQDYQMKSDQAAARDRINQFNTQNAQSVQQRNVAADNAGQMYNLDRSQAISNANTDMANKEQQYNKELVQKNYENQMQKAGAIGNLKTGQATNIDKAGATTAQQYGAIGSAAGQTGTAIQGQNNWDAWLDATKKKKLDGQAYGGGDADPSYGSYT